MATEPIMRPNKRPIFHYTDTAGLIGIVENATLRATNSHFLNDSLELKFGTELLREALLKEAQVAIEGDSIEAGVSQEFVSETLTAMARLVDESAIGDTYVASFSTEGDSLPQWRAYANLGFAIEFDGNDILGPTSETDESFRGMATLGDVMYGDDARMEAAALARSVKKDVLERPSIGHDDVHIRGYVSSSATSIGTSLPFLKQSSFADEREVRLSLGYGTEPGGFKPSHLMGPVPFANWRFSRKAIRRVIVGPGANMDIRAKSAEYLLARFVPTRTEVVPSRSSFRG